MHRERETLRAFLHPKALSRDWRALSVVLAAVIVILALFLGVLHLLGVITIPFTDIGNGIATGFVPIVVTVVAFAALALLTQALRAQAELRSRELDLQRVAVEADAVRRQGELVNAIRLRLSMIEGSSEEERQELAAELTTATQRYVSVLRGFIRSRPEIARLERDAIASYLAEAEGELRRLRVDSSAAFDDILLTPAFDPAETPLRLPNPFDDAPSPNGSAVDDVPAALPDDRRRHA